MRHFVTQNTILVIVVHKHFNKMCINLVLTIMQYMHWTYRLYRLFISIEFCSTLISIKVLLKFPCLFLSSQFLSLFYRVKHLDFEMFKYYYISLMNLYLYTQYKISLFICIMIFDWDFMILIGLQRFSSTCVFISCSFYLLMSTECIHLNIFTSVTWSLVFYLKVQYFNLSLTIRLSLFIPHLYTSHITHFSLPYCTVILFVPGKGSLPPCLFSQYRYFFRSTT